jgi:hypothetical protein
MEPCGETLPICRRQSETLCGFSAENRLIAAASDPARRRIGLPPLEAVA